MLDDSLNKSLPEQVPKRRTHQWRYLFILPPWVAVGFIAAALAAGIVLKLLTQFVPIVSGLNSIVLSTITAALVYALALVLVLLLPRAFKRGKLSREALGLSRLPSWLDIALALAGLIVYGIASVIISLLVKLLLPHLVNFDQTQDVGFSNLNASYEYVLAFLTLVIIAPLAEETLFRGYLYGKLRAHVPMIVSMLVTSALFGAVHGQWNVGIDVFALSMVLCSLREITGSIWAGVLVHMLKNGIAFYFLFINPSILSTMGILW